jgi:hypothetical protein
MAILIFNFNTISKFNVHLQTFSAVLGAGHSQLARLEAFIHSFELFDGPANFLFASIERFLEIIAICG